MIKKSFILAIALLLSGCGAKFVYNNLSMITPWYVDDYVDLNRDQKNLYKKHLKNIHQWHRREELPEYYRLLSELRAHLDQSELEKNFLTNHLLQLRQRWQVLTTYATPALTEMAQTLTDDQIQELKVALEETNLENLADAEQPSEHNKSIQQGIKRWLGNLSQEQQKSIQSFAESHPDRTIETVAAHRAFQAQLMHHLADRHSDNFPAQLAKLIADPLQSPEGKKLTSLRLDTLNSRIELYQTLWGQASARQKQKVIDRLDDILKDIKSLMNE